MFTLSQIAEALGRPVLGDGTMALMRATEPQSAGPDDLALAMSPRYSEALAGGDARAAILWDGADWEAMGLRGAVTVPRPRLAMAGITRALDLGPGIPVGVHPTAVIDASAQVADGVGIGPFSVIGAGAVIGRDVRIGAHASIGAGVELGVGCLLMPRVTLGERVCLGARAIVQAGAVIGGDGFSFVTEQTSSLERVRASLGEIGPAVAQPWIRIHSLGTVRIGADVEIGANATIDRGTVADTTIGHGTKIDNLVMIGHNVRIGEDCLICSQVGISGGTVLGDRVVLGGKVGVNDNITIGDDVVAGGGSNLYTRVRAGDVVLGSPAVPMRKNLAMYRALRRLPRAMEQLAELRAAVARGRGGASDGR